MTMQTTFVNVSQVPDYLRTFYNGKTFKVATCERYMVPCTAGRWDSGSKDSYILMMLATGATVHNYGNLTRDAEVTISPDLVLARHSIFMGKDSGVTYFVHPKAVMPMLPAPIPKMTQNERILLWAMRSLKASHGGHDRYSLCERELHAFYRQPFMTRDEWQTARESLRDLGLLSQGFSMTVGGKNASESIQRGDLYREG